MTKCTYDAVSYLTGKGYKKIAHFTGPEDLGICKLRLKGYTDALKAANLPIQNELIRYGGLHETDGYNAMDILLKENNLPDAIFAVNDPVAVGAFQRIKEAGLKIPGDIGIVGFSNNKITSLVDPPMTTVDQPSFEMGKRATELLIEMIENEKIPAKPKTIVLEAKLIVRSST